MGSVRIIFDLIIISSFRASRMSEISASPRGQILDDLVRYGVTSHIAKHLQRMADGLDLDIDVVLLFPGQLGSLGSQANTPHRRRNGAPKTC